VIEKSGNDYWWNLTLLCQREVLRRVERPGNCNLLLCQALGFHVHEDEEVLENPLLHYKHAQQTGNNDCSLPSGENSSLVNVHYNKEYYF